MKKKKENKWILVIDNQAREAFIRCPVCNEMYPYDILSLINKCAKCGALMGEPEEVE